LIRRQRKPMRVQHIAEVFRDAIVNAGATGR
jgi:hypothetical protein